MPDTNKQVESKAPSRSSVIPGLTELHENGQPIVLTINGKCDFIVEDAGSCEQLLNLVDRLETIEGIRRGLESMEQGKGRPLDQVMTEIRDKYELSD